MKGTFLFMVIGPILRVMRDTGLRPPVPPVTGVTIFAVGNSATVFRFVVAMFWHKADMREPLLA